MLVKLISNQEQFLNLKEPWIKLQSSGAVKDITTTWEWMSTWWEVFNDGRTLAVLVAMDDNEVIGIVPLIQRKIRYFNLIPYMRIEFMASGEDEKDEICSDYLDFIIKEGQEKEVLKAIFEFLCGWGNITWDELLLPRMCISSPTVSVLFKMAKSFRLGIEEIKRLPCRYINLPASFEEYLNQLGRNTRWNIRHGMRRLSEMGDVSFKTAKTIEETQSAKATLIQLHQSRWTQKGKFGVFSSDKFRSFHDKMMTSALRKGWLRLGTLFLNEKPVACLYNFRFKDRIYFYQSGMEASNLRYGMLAHAYAIAHATSEGVKEYDFLAGASGYKERLAKDQREIITLRISKSSPKESLYKIVSRLKAQAKTVRDCVLRKKKQALKKLEQRGC